MKFRVELVRHTSMWLATCPACLSLDFDKACRCARFPTLSEAMTYAARRSTTKDRPPATSGEVRRT